jgi:TonB family protein
VQFIITPPKDVVDPLMEKLKKEDKGESGAKAALKEGDMGHKNKKKIPDMRTALKAIKPQDKELVMKQGLLGILNTGAGGNNNPFGGTGLGGDLRSALGGVIGTRIGDSGGMGGLGLAGMGPGGGGNSFNSIGLGSVGTRGRGGGEGGYGVGYGLGQKGERGISLGAGTPIIMGSLDKELVRRVIHAHRNEIKYCYERELVRSPGLFGKVTINFVIDANGRVQTSKVKETTLNNPTVERCVLDKARLWTFPKPKGGGIVVVTYPFIFKQAG